MSNNLISQFTVGNIVININYDDMEFDFQDILNCSYPIYLYTWHKRYQIGTPNPFETREEMFMHILCIQSNTAYKYSANELLNKAKKECVILPVYMLDHGSIALSTDSFYDRWDSGLLGYIFSYKEDIRDALNVKRVSPKTQIQVQNLFNSQLETISNIYNGNVFYISINDKTTDDVIDSCGGFIGTNWNENGVTEYIEQYIDISETDLINMIDTSYAIA